MAASLLPHSNISIREKTTGESQVSLYMRDMREFITMSYNVITVCPDSKYRDKGDLSRSTPVLLLNL